MRPFIRISSSSLALAFWMLVSFASLSKLLLYRHFVWNGGASLRGFHRDLTGYDVCILSGDPPLNARSRGTANAMWAVVEKAVRDGMRAKVFTFVPEQGHCADRARLPKEIDAGVDISCRLFKESSTSGLRAPAMAAEELKSTECKIVFSHEWWGILGEALTEDRLLSREPGYFSIVNVHGATIWAESYIKNRNLSYGDTILDLQERQGFYFADAAVFPSYYMESFHRNVNKWVMQPASHVIPNIMKVGNTASLRNNVKPFRGIGFIGGLEYRKALDVVVDAMHHVKVPKELIPFPVHVYGPKGRGWDKINGISSAEYINRSCTASPHIECIFRGFMRTEDMWADMVKRELIFIMASRKENQPMAILEAASNRLPVIILRKGYSDEMLTEKGVSECIIPHSVEALGNRLQVLLDQGGGYVPELHAKLGRAQQEWDEFFSKAIQITPGQYHNFSFDAMPLQFETYIVPPIIKHADVYADLCGFGAWQPVLLKNPDFRLRAGTKEILEQIAGRINGTNVAGVTANVMLSDGLEAFSRGVHGFITRDWYACAEESPILIQRDVLCAYTELFPDNDLKQWQLHQWLVHGELLGRKQVANLPRTLYDLEGVDPTKCFWADAKVGKPQEDVQRWEKQNYIDVEFGLPVLAASSMWKDNYDHALRLTCRNHDIPEMWFKVATDATFCGRHSDHGVHNTQMLKMTLLAQCGAWCAFSPFNGLDSAQIGWYLKEEGSCWTPITFIDGHCTEWYGPWRKGHGDSHFPIKYHRKTSTLRERVTEHCDQLTEDKCGPSVLLVSHPSCGARGIADLLNKHPQVVAPSESIFLQHTDVHEVSGLYHLALRRLTSDAELSELVQEFAADLPVTDGRNTITYAFSPLWLPHEASGSVPRILDELLPHVKIVFSLCDPLSILGWIYERELQDSTALRTSKTFNVRYKLGHLNFNYTSLESFLTDIANLDNNCKEDVISTDSHCIYLRMLRIESIYIEHMQDWFGEFASERTFVLNWEALTVEPRPLLQNVLEFLQLPVETYPWESIPLALSNGSQQEGPAAQQVKEVMKLYNHDLDMLLQIDMSRNW